MGPLENTARTGLTDFGFLSDALRPDPRDRLSARSLLQASWFNGVLSSASLIFCTICDRWCVYSLNRFTRRPVYPFVEYTDIIDIVDRLIKSLLWFEFLLQRSNPPVVGDSQSMELPGGGVGNRCWVSARFSRRRSSDIFLQHRAAG